MKIRHAALSDVGMKRAHNEDSFLLNPELGLFVVADGMGGHAGGETASRVAVSAIEQELVAARTTKPESFSATGPLDQSPLASVVREALEGACAAVYHVAHTDAALEGMGTTATALVLHHNCAFAGHVGDSRFYMVRNGEIQQISEDHSLVQEQVKARILTPDQARTSRFKNIITRSIGFEEDVLVDVLGVALEAGDSMLLCSDGLSNLVDDRELCDALVRMPLNEVPFHLVQLANAHGGDDNITVIALHVDELDPV
jgi:protein phosphatase